MKGFRYLLIAKLMSFSLMAQAGVMLQAFHWDAVSGQGPSWWMQLASQSQELSDAGFTSLWIPPVLKGASGGYSRGYDPFDDYDLGSKDQRGTIPTHWGSRWELQRMVAQARANGMQVIIDLNVSHRAGDSGDKKYLYKNAFGQDGKGRFQKGPMDFGDDFPFGRLLNFYSPYVRAELKQAGEWMVKSLGTQGLRVDSAKHIPADFLSDYLNYGELQKQYTVLEHWDNQNTINDYVKNKMNSRVGAFDFPLWNDLKEMSSGAGFFDMRRLQRSGLLGMSPELSVTFVENHDTDRAYATRNNKHLGYAYILTSEGYPCVFWKDYYDYQMKDLINNLIWIHEGLAHGPTEYRWADNDLLVYERTGEPGVLVGMNDSSWETRTEWVQTHFGANVELNDYSGKAGSIWTDGQGRVQISVPPNQFVAYSRAGIQFQLPKSSYKVTQEFFGAEDLDIPPAVNGKFQNAGYIYVQGGTSIEWDLNYERNAWKDSTKLIARILSEDNQVIMQESYGPSVGWAKGSVQASKTGWYRLEMAAENAPSPVKFWWKQTYQAPR
jgi:Glycosidases